MDITIAIRNRTLQLCEKHKISPDKLAILSRISHSTMKNVLYGASKKPQILTIKMLCDGLGITLGEFFSTPEFDNLEQEIR